GCARSAPSVRGLMKIMASGTMKQPNGSVGGRSTVPPTKTFLRSFAVAALLRFFQIRNALLYASARDGALAKIGTFATCIPLIVLSAVVWAGAWAFVLFAAVRLFHTQ